MAAGKYARELVVAHEEFDCLATLVDESKKWFALLIFSPGRKCLIYTIYFMVFVFEIFTFSNFYTQNFNVLHYPILVIFCTDTKFSQHIEKCDGLF